MRKIIMGAIAFLMVLVACCCISFLSVDQEATDVSNDGQGSYTISGSLSGQEGDQFRITLLNEDETKAVDPVDARIGSGNSVDFSISLSKVGTYYILVYKIGSDTPYFSTISLTAENQTEYGSMSISIPDEPKWKTPTYTKNYKVNVTDPTSTVNSNIVSVTGTKEDDELSYVVDEKTHLAKLIYLGKTAYKSRSAPVATPCYKSDIEFRSVITFDEEQYYVSHVSPQGSGGSKLYVNTTFGSSFTSLTFNNPISIKDNAFSNSCFTSNTTKNTAYGVAKIEFKDMVYGIGDGGFQGSNIQQIVFSGGIVGDVGDDAFKNSKIQAIDISMPYGGKIGDSAFAGCSALSTVGISSDCSSGITIGAGIFEGVKAMRSGDTDFAEVPLDSLTLKNVVFGDTSSFGTGVLDSKKMDITLPSGSGLTFENEELRSGGAVLAEIRYGSSFSEGYEQYTMNGITYRLASSRMDCVSQNYAQVESIGEMTADRAEITIPAKITKDGTEYTVTEIGTGEIEKTDTVKHAQCVVQGITFDQTLCTFSAPVSFKLTIEGDVVVNDYAFVRYESVRTVAGSEDYFGSTGLSELVINGTISKIGQYAFAESKITSIDLSKTLEIGNHSFRKSDVTSVTLCEGISIGQYAFAESKISSTLTIPDKCTVGWRAFQNTNVERIEVGSEVVLGDSVFEYCTSLTKCEITLQNIPYGTFYGCSSLKQITLPDNVSIGELAFGSSGLGSIDLSKVSSIGVEAFRNTCLTQVTIPSTVQLQESSGYGGQFTGCMNLSVVNFQCSSIPDGCFSDCTALVTFSFDGDGIQIGKQAFKNTGIQAFDLSKASKVGQGAFQGSALTSVSITSGLEFDSGSLSPFKDCLKLSEADLQREVLPAYLFDGCTALVTVKMTGVKTIGDYAFNGCTSLMMINLGSVTQIGEGSFAGSSLATLTLSNNLTTIGKQAFMSTKISTVTIPASVSSFGDWVFKDCISLESVSFDGTRETIGNKMFQGCTSLKTVGFPQGIKNIQDAAFYGCSSLDISSAEFQLSRDEILQWSPDAFGGTKAIVREKIEDSESSYYEYLKLTIRDGDSTRSVMFLTDVVGASNVSDKGNYRQILPSNLEGIYDRAFNSGLTAVSIDENSLYEAVDGVLYQKSGADLILLRAPIYTEFYEIPSGVTVIGEYSFRGCSLQEISIPASVRSIGNYAFSMNTGLRIVELNEGLASIGDYAFYSCNIGELSIPSSVLSIGMNAFGSNTRLSALELPMDSKLETIGQGAFTSAVIESVFLPSLKEYPTSAVFPSTLKAVYLASGIGTDVGTIFNKNSTIQFYLPVGMNKTAFDFSSFGGCKSGSFADYYVVSDGSFVPCNKNIAVGENTVYFITSVGELEIKDLSKSEKTVIFGISAKGGYSYHDLTLTSGDTTLSHDNGIFTMVVDSDVFVTVSERSVSEYYDLSFDSAGGSSVKTISIGAGRTLLDGQYPVPTKDSMEFAGWFVTDSVEFTEDTPVEQSMRVVAHWTASTPMIRFHADLGLVTASCGDQTISDETRIEKGSTISFTYVPMDCTEFICWQITSGGLESTSTDKILTLSDVDNDITVTVKERYHSNSSGLTPIINTDTPKTDEQLSILWNTSFTIDTSTMQWTGHSSVPLIVDDHVYVRASDKLYMIEADTGFVIRSVSSTSVTQFYHYLGYAHGLIVDYATGKVYDCELNAYDATIGTVSSVFSDETSTYVYGSGTLTKYDASLTTEQWTKTLDHTIFGQYGTTSSVVLNGGYLYYIHAGSNSDERGICAIDCSTGEEKQYLKLDKIAGFYLDDGWMTCYNDTLYMTCYTVGLFGSKVGEGKEGYVVAIPLQSGTLGSPTYTESGNLANSEFVVYNGRGYVNAGYSLMVYNVDRANLTKAYSVSTAYSHGGIVVDTAYATEENNQEVLIYLIPYSPGSGLYVVADHAGQTSGAAVRMSTGTPQYNSQAVRSTMDGKLVWYTDSGNVFSVGSSRLNDYYFFIEGPSRTAWYHATGATAADALESLGSDTVTLGESKQLVTVGGKSATDWKMWCLASNGQPTGSSDYSWKELSNLYDAVNDTIHYYLISKALPDDGAEYSYIDGSSVRSYEFAKNIGDRDVVGKTMTAGKAENMVVIRFYDEYGSEIEESALIGERGSEIQDAFPNVYKSGYALRWTDASGQKVSTPVEFPSEDVEYHVSWLLAYTMSIDVEVNGALTYFDMATERKTGGDNLEDPHILLIAEYGSGIFVNVFSDELVFGTMGDSKAKVGVTTKDLVGIHAYLVSGTPTGAFESYGECAYAVTAG